MAQTRDARLANEVRVVCHQDVMQIISARGKIDRITAQWYKYFATCSKLYGSLHVKTYPAQASATRHNTTKKASYKQTIFRFIATI